jgi:predicted ester cyclase
MNKDNVSIAVDWFTATWTNKGYNPNVLRELADEKVFFKYPLHGERHGVEKMIEALETLYASFPDLDFRVVGDIISDGKYVAAKWTGGGTHTGIAFSDNPFKTEIPANSGKAINFSGMTIYVIENGKVVSEIGQEEAIDVALQLGLIAPVK